MTTTINADTVVGGAIITSDASGVLALQAAGVTKLTVNGTGVTLATPLAVASGGTGGSATPTAGGVVYGTGTVQAVTAAGTSGQVLTSAGASAPTWGTVSAGFTLGTPVATTSGTSFTFTGIPAGTKQIVMTFSGVSSSGGNNKLIQLGDAGGIEISGYDASNSHSIVNATVTNQGSSAQGFALASVLGAQELSGAIILTLENATSYTWTVGGILTDPPNSLFLMAGKKSLSQELTQVRLTSVSGAQTFDAGEINIAYI